MAADEGSEGGFWPSWLTPRRFFEFAQNVYRMERSIADLRTENASLRSDVLKLQNDVAQQNAQIDILKDFLRASLTKRD